MAFGPAVPSCGCIAGLRPLNRFDSVAPIARFDPRRRLSDPQLYKLAQIGFGARRSRERLASRFIRAGPGDRILDIGCGTGDILDVLPEVDYLGFDLSRKYVAAARARYESPRTRFQQSDVLDADLAGEEPFDLVLATGVIHHLDDVRAAELIRLAADLLGPEGRLVTLDGAYVAGQPQFARWILDRDRGNYVRTADEYIALCAEHFADPRHEIVTDFLYIPYTHCVMDARRPR